MPSYKEVYRGAYLKSSDIPREGMIRDLRNVLIVKFDEGEKLVGEFLGDDRALVINATNAEALERIFRTDNFDLWRGPIQLYVDHNVKFGNRTVEGIRVSQAPVRPADIAAQATGQPAPPWPPANVPVREDHREPPLPPQGQAEATGQVSEGARILIERIERAGSQRDAVALQSISEGYRAQRASYGSVDQQAIEAAGVKARALVDEPDPVF